MRRRIGVWARRAAIGLMIAWSLFPVYWALNTSLMTNAEAQSTPTHFLVTRPIFTNYQAIFGAGPQSAEAAGGISRSLVNIVVESGGATLLTLVIAILGAYAFARLRFRLKNLFFYTVLGTLTLPVYATLIPLYRIMSEVGLVNTYLGIILVYASGFMPLAMWIMYNVFLALPPSIEEA
jgi:multiple sugar transport system permease protein